MSKCAICEEPCHTGRTKCKKCCFTLQKEQNKANYKRMKQSDNRPICNVPGCVRLVEPYRPVCSTHKKQKTKVKTNEQKPYKRVGVDGCYYAEYLLDCKLLTFNAFSEVSKVSQNLSGHKNIDSKNEVYLVFDAHNKDAEATNAMGETFRDTLKHDLKEVIDPFVKGKIKKDFNDSNRHAGHAEALIYADSSQYPQISHMDTEYDEYQVLMVLSAKDAQSRNQEQHQETEKHPCTLVIPQETNSEQFNQNVDTATEFLLGKNNSGDSSGRDWQEITYYRHLLQPREQLCNSLVPCNPQGNWSVGTISIMKGGVVHCAPAHEGPRIVLFLVYSPTNASARYDRDTQITPWSVISDTFLYKAGVSSVSKKIKATHKKVMDDWGKDPRCRSHHSYQNDLAVHH